MCRQPSPLSLNCPSLRGRTDFTGTKSPVASQGRSRQNRREAEYRCSQGPHLLRYLSRACRPPASCQRLPLSAPRSLLGLTRPPRHQVHHLPQPHWGCQAQTVWMPPRRLLRPRRETGYEALWERHAASPCVACAYLGAFPALFLEEELFFELVVGVVLVPWLQELESGEKQSMMQPQGTPKPCGLEGRSALNPAMVQGCRDHTHYKCMLGNPRHGTI